MHNAVALSHAAGLAVLLLVVADLFIEEELDETRLAEAGEDRPLSGGPGGAEVNHPFETDSSL